MARFGRLHLGNGTRNGRTIIPLEWAGKRAAPHGRGGVFDDGCEHIRPAPRAVRKVEMWFNITMSDTISIREAVMALLQIVQRLRSAFPPKKFTLDGRLVGDIGEILVEAEYDLTLFEKLERQHDGKTQNGRLVQIKATMQKSLTFPADHIPNYYIGIQVHPDGSFSEVFNGPGAVVAESLRNRKAPKTNLHSVSVRALAALDTKVDAKDRIRRRCEASLPPTPPTRPV